MSLANCVPLNAVLGRFSSAVFLSAVGFFGRLALGPAKFHSVFWLQSTVKSIKSMFALFMQENVGYYCIESG